MRITIVTGPFLGIPPSPCGAVERVWWDMAREFVGRGHEVAVCCRSESGFAHESVRDGVRMIERRGGLATSMALMNLVKDGLYGMRVCGALPPADILVTNSFSMPVLAGHRKARSGHLCVNVQRMPKGQMGLYHRVGVARFLAVSRAVEAAIVHECPRAADRVRVVGNPYRQDIFVPPAAPRDWSAPMRFLYAGRVHPEKGLELLVQAFRRVHAADTSCELTLVGPWQTERGGGGPGYRAAIEKLAEGLPVRFLEPIAERSGLAAVHQQAHVFVYPSLAERGETFGVAPLEAMATGAIPLVSMLDCFDDFLPRTLGRCRFDHRAGDPVGALASAMTSLMNDRASLPALSDEVSQLVRPFESPAIATRYLEVFEELLRA